MSVSLREQYINELASRRAEVIGWHHGFARLGSLPSDLSVLRAIVESDFGAFNRVDVRRITPQELRQLDAAHKACLNYIRVLQEYHDPIYWFRFSEFSFSRDQDSRSG